MIYSKFRFNMFNGSKQVGSASTSACVSQSLTFTFESQVNDVPADSSGAPYVSRLVSLAVSLDPPSSDFYAIGCQYDPFS